MMENKRNPIKPKIQPNTIKKMHAANCSGISIDTIRLRNLALSDHK
jgi:hypothetical protein